jgi:hypothetical protein
MLHREDWGGRAHHSRFGYASQVRSPPLRRECASISCSDADRHRSRHHAVAGERIVKPCRSQERQAESAALEDDACLVRGKQCYDELIRIVSMLVSIHSRVALTLISVCCMAFLFGCVGLRACINLIAVSPACIPLYRYKPRARCAE